MRGPRESRGPELAFCNYPKCEHGDRDGKGILKGTGFLTLHLFSEAVHIIGLVGVPDSIGSHSRELILITIATFPGSVDRVSVGKSMWECDTKNRGDPKVTVLVAFASIGGDRGIKLPLSTSALHASCPFSLNAAHESGCLCYQVLLVPNTLSPKTFSA